MNTNKPEILKYTISHNDYQERLLRPRNQLSYPGEHGEINIVYVHDAEYMQQAYKNQINIPDYALRDGVLPGDQIKLHTSRNFYFEDIFWASVDWVDVLPTGEKLFFAHTYESNTQIPNDTVFGPIKVCNICDINTKSGIRTDEYEVEAMYRGVKNA